MSEPNRRQEAVRWQNRYVAPVLLVVGAILSLLSAWAGAIPWWLGIVIAVFCVAAVVMRQRR